MPLVVGCPFFVGQWVVTTLLDPDLLYAVVSHSELDFGGAQKIEDLTDSKNFFTEILQKNTLILFSEKKLGVRCTLREHPSENHAVLKYGSTSTLSDFVQILCRVTL